MRSCLPTIVEPTKYVETTRSINGAGKSSQESTNYQVETKVHLIAPERDAIDNELSSGDHHMTKLTNRMQYHRTHLSAAISQGRQIHPCIF